jgi:hypothetical protein
MPFQREEIIDVIFLLVTSCITGFCFGPRSI